MGLPAAAHCRTLISNPPPAWTPSTLSNKWISKTSKGLKLYREFEVLPWAMLKKTQVHAQAQDWSDFDQVKI